MSAPRFLAALVACAGFWWCLSRAERSLQQHTAADPDHAGQAGNLENGLGDEHIVPLPPPPVPDLVIDAGHGGNDPGTSANGEQEKGHALSVALAVAAELEKKGRKVTLTRSKDERVEVDARWMLANTRPRIAFISIHFNADGNSAESRGIETLYSWPRKPDTMLRLQTELKIPSGSTFTDHRSRLLAEHIQRGLIATTGARDRGAKNRADLPRDDLAVTSRTVMPSVLVECGFLSNAAECERIKDKTYRAKIVTGIVNGIESWLTETATPGSGIEITPPPGQPPAPPPQAPR